MRGRSQHPGTLGSPPVYDLLVSVVGERGPVPAVLELCYLSERARLPRDAVEAIECSARDAALSSVVFGRFPTASYVYVVSKFPVFLTFRRLPNLVVIERRHICRGCPLTLFTRFSSYVYEELGRS